MSTYAGVAQLVEQLICNQQVGGSSPSTSSNSAGNSRRNFYGRIPEWPKGADCKSVAFTLRWFESIFSHQNVLHFMQDIFYAVKKTLFKQNVFLYVD